MTKMSLETHRPFFCFHQEETVYPQDFNFYLPQCEMVCNGKTRYTHVCCCIPDTPVAISCCPPQKKTIRGDILYTIGNINETIPIIDNEGRDCYLDYKGLHQHPLQPEAPIYGYRKKKGEKTELWYHVFYPYQMPYYLSCCDVLRLYVGGEHQADLETVVVVLDSKEEVESVIYYQHGDPTTYCKDDIEFIEKHPLVYIANISHASYPHPGTYRRLWGFANDKCSTLQDGRLWKVNKVIDLETIDPNHFIRWYRGDLGNDGVSSFENRFNVSE